MKKRIVSLLLALVMVLSLVHLHSGERLHRYRGPLHRG